MTFNVTANASWPESKVLFVQQDIEHNILSTSISYHCRTDSPTGL